MSRFTAHSRRATSVVALAAAAVLAFSGLAAADTVTNDVTNGINGNSTITTGASVTITYVVNANNAGGLGFNGCDASDGTPMTLAISVPAGVTVNNPSLVFTACGSAGAKTATFTSATAGDYSITHTTTDSHGNYTTGGLNWTLHVNPPAIADADGDGVADADDNCVDVANTDQANADGDAFGDLCDDNSYAPIVGDLAPAADGNEGTPGNPTTTGSFTDADGNETLTLSLGVGDPGTLTLDGNGGFIWSHTTTDDASGSVTVTASDGEHTDVSQTFNWSAANVAPVIDDVLVTAGTDACSVDLSAVFSDQGTADTHSSSIDWGDSSATTDTDPDLTPVTGSHTYGSAGTFTASVTVTDDDGGATTESPDDGFTTKNTPSAIMQPINSTGTKSSFKIGSTIPVKITVTDCGGQAVTNLSPTVTLYKLDSVPNPGVDEQVTTTVATNGLNMRWSDTLYIYNLSTKLSQQTGAALTAGSYRVAVNDASFFSRSTADFELRK